MTKFVRVWCRALVSTLATSPPSLVDDILGRRFMAIEIKGGRERPSMHLTCFKCLQLKIINIPKRRISVVCPELLHRVYVFPVKHKALGAGPKGVTSS